VFNLEICGNGVGKGRRGRGGGSGSGSMSRLVENLSIIFFTLGHGWGYRELHQSFFADYC